MSHDPIIDLSIDSGIARMVLNRGEEGNPISDAFVRELEAVTIALADRRDVRALLISAAGPRFSVGGDIREFAGDLDALPSNLRRWNASLNASVARLARIEAPSVVAVQGTVAGGALSIIAGCDIIVAAPGARFVAAYASIGYCPDLGGTVSLVRRIGLSRARRFHLLHEKLDARTALDIGLVDFVCDPDDVAVRALEIAQRWATGPTRAYGAIRRLMQDASHMPLEAQLELETQGIVEMARTEDARSALTAFLAKETPVYRGR